MSAVGLTSAISEVSREPSPEASQYDAFVQRREGENRLRLIIRGAKCGGCLSKIENSVSVLPGVSSARLNLSNGEMRVSWQGALKAGTIANTISDLGYAVAPERAEQGDDDGAREERALLISMGVAGFAAANIMLLSVSVWAGHGEMGETTRRTLHALSGAIALPVLIFSGRHFFRSAFNVLRRGHANMDVPISLALCLAFGVSVSETLRGGPHAYFDAAVMLLFFLLIGRFLEARLKRRAYSAANALAAMRNKPVTVMACENKTVSMPAEDIVDGDTILLAPGERAMLDMRIAEGSSDVDESLITGESLPRLLRPGMVIRAGAINLSASVRGTAIGTADNSLLSTIAEMLEAGEQRRSSYRKLADRAVSLYIPFVHLTAALAGLAWLLLGASVSQALMISVTTLIITCPCALALAAPVAQVVAAGRLFDKGVFLRSGDALERLAEVDHIAFDKTGTLTLGTPKLHRVFVGGTEISQSSQEALDLIEQAASLARASLHPLSRALAGAAGASGVQVIVEETPGKGLEATIKNSLWRLGSGEWVGAAAPETASGPLLFFRRGREPLVCFAFEDQVQTSAQDALDRLRSQNITMEIMSGDRRASVEALANAVGIDDWTAECTPESKVERLEALRSAGRKTLMVGDGLNDTGALSLAHASLAPGNAMDISQSASDAVYCGDLTDIPVILKIARRTRSIMRQNFAFAAGYNLFAVPIAVAGLVTPLIAAIAMSSSSIIVTLNALTLQTGKS